MHWDAAFDIFMSYLLSIFLVFFSLQPPFLFLFPSCRRKLAETLRYSSQCSANIQPWSSSSSQTARAPTCRTERARPWPWPALPPSSRQCSRDSRLGRRNIEANHHRLPRLEADLWRLQIRPRLPRHLLPLLPYFLTLPSPLPTPPPPASPPSSTFSRQRTWFLHIGPTSPAGVAPPPLPPPHRRQ